jgi:hypothetical protein
MGFFDTLFGNRPRQPSPAEEVTRILERFATATSMGVDREDLARYPAKQRQVMAFHNVLKLLSFEAPIVGVK